MLENITPVILTFNEEKNIERNLSRLGWARNIIVVDSYSTDETVSILSRYSPVRVSQRKFDNHANQWNYAVHETGIDTEWVLALDADYILTDEFVAELENLSPADEIMGYQAGFIYCINGKPLRGSLYPPATVLFRPGKASYIQDGHTQRLVVDGRKGELNSKILHDDRKPFSRWLSSQTKYMKLEADLIAKTPFASLALQDKIRKMVIFAPFLTFFYCLVYRKLILDGGAGIYYSLLRTLAEFMLSWQLLCLHINKRPEQ